MDEELLRIAAKLKAKYPISYADIFAAAMTDINNAFLLNGDPEFQALKKKELFHRMAHLKEFYQFNK